MDLTSTNARAARNEAERIGRENNCDVSLTGYDKDGETVYLSLVRVVTKGNVATATRNRSGRAVRFTAQLKKGV